MENENIVIWASDSNDQPVKNFIVQLPPKTKSRIFKRADHYAEMTVDQLLANREILEKVHGSTYPLYELKFRISPPIRAISIIWKNKVVVLKMFKGSGSNGRLGKEVTRQVIEMADNWKLRFP